MHSTSSPAVAASSASLPDRVERAAEVAIFLARRGRQEILVVHRCPRLGSFWHAISGAVEAGESVEGAAVRELCEETGLDATETLPLCTRTEFSYRLRQPPWPMRKSVRVCCFLLDVPDAFEPTLDWEHDDHRWIPTELAPLQLRWPTLRGALLALLSLADGAGAGRSSTAERSQRPASLGAQARFGDGPDVALG
ncbi:MAG: lipoate-protein ligase [Actinomycetia bacterium]|nr:lipoate-protein ligase [Actinomycetes bacterium]